MRVLHCVAGLGMGGAEQQLVLLCRETADTIGHEIAAAGAEAFHERELAEIGVPVHRLGIRHFGSPLLPLRLARAIRASRPDILHCWLPSMNLAGALASVLSLPARPAVIASIRNVDDWKSPLRTAVDRAVSHLWDGVLCNSRAGLECARRQGIADAKLRWVPNGVVARVPIEAAERRRLRERFGAGEGGALLVSACRLVAQKRVHLLLPLMASLRARFPGLRLLVCGDGPLGPQLRQQCASLGLGDAVHFLGAVDDAWPFLCAADALVMTSLREGTSNTLLEAMQAGCAVFATGAGDNALLVNGQAGWVGDSGGMVAAIETALAGPDLLERYRAAAPRRAAEFTVAKMAASTLAHYAELARPAPGWSRHAAAMGKGR